MLTNNLFTQTRFMVKLFPYFIYFKFINFFLIQILRSNFEFYFNQYLNFTNFIINYLKNYFI